MGIDRGNQTFIDSEDHGHGAAADTGDQHGASNQESFEREEPIHGFLLLFLWMIFFILCGRSRGYTLKVSRTACGRIGGECVPGDARLGEEINF